MKGYEMSSYASLWMKGRISTQELDLGDLGSMNGIDSSGYTKLSSTINYKSEKCVKRPNLIDKIK